MNRYKFRKREAVRRLEKTALNLTRLQDILRELGDQLEGKPEAAGPATSSTSWAQSELQQLETRLALNDWVQLNLNFSRLQESSRKAELAMQESQTRAAALAGQAEELNEAKTALEAARDACNQELSGLREQIGITRARSRLHRAAHPHARRGRGQRHGSLRAVPKAAARLERRAGRAGAAAALGQRSASWRPSRRWPE